MTQGGAKVQNLRHFFFLFSDTAYWDQSYQYTITIGVIVPMVISVFLIMVICLLFVMIRRCRRARLREAEANDRLNTLSEEVSTRRGMFNYMSHDMRFSTMWHFDKCRLRRASAASFKAKKQQMVFSQ